MKSRTCLALVLVELATMAPACSSKSEEPALSPYSSQPGDGTGGSNQAQPDASSCKPKTGYEQVAKLDSDWLTDDGHVAMVLDQDGNPMVAWVAFDATSTPLRFSVYDPASCQWVPSVQVDDLGSVTATRDREVTLARDASTGRLGLAYQVIDDSANQSLILAQSDDRGATWTKEVVVKNPDGNVNKGVSRPTVAMKDGKTYLAYYQTYLYSSVGSYGSDNSGFVLLTRDATAGDFSSTNIPAVGDTSLPGSEPFPPSLAIDDSGDAGLAYFALTDDTGQNLRLAYYHTGQDKSVAVFDSEQQSNSVADASLIFQGTEPRIAASLQRGSSDANNSKLWFSSSDTASAWGAPVELPMDGGDAMGPDVALAAGADGTLSVAANYGSGDGTHQCGAPKLSTSDDAGDTWSTCGPDINSKGNITYAGRYVQLAYAPSGKRVAAFSAVRQGVWLWREP
jgi:hypothetical protein